VSTTTHVVTAGDADFTDEYSPPSETGAFLATNCQVSHPRHPRTPRLLSKELESLTSHFFQAPMRPIRKNQSPFEHEKKMLFTQQFPSLRQFPDHTTNPSFFPLKSCSPIHETRESMEKMETTPSHAAPPKRATRIAILAVPLGRG
jgi:hypothetical protein